MFTRQEVKELKKRMIDKRLRQKDLCDNIEGLSKSMCSSLFALKTTSSKLENEIKEFINE